MNASFKFPSSVLVDIGSRVDAVKAEYKWKPKSCETCLHCGHNSKKCPNNTVQPLQGGIGAGLSITFNWQPRMYQNRRVVVPQSNGNTVQQVGVPIERPQKSHRNR